MFWRTKPTVDADTEAWILEAWRWLDQTLTPDSANHPPALVLPSAERFPATPKQGHPRAEHYFELTRSYCGMRESDWPCQLVAQDERLRWPRFWPADVVWYPRHLSD